MDVLLVLALLACPVGMGLMMWFMGRNMKVGEKASSAESSAGHAPRSVAELSAEQSRLSAEIEGLERGEAVPYGELGTR